MALSTLSFTAGRLDALGKSTKEIDSTIEKLKKLVKDNQ